MTDIITLIWLSAGVLLMILELVAPGLVTVFLGAAAVIVAGLRWIGLVESLGVSFALWMILSAVLVIALRSVLQRFLPSESTHNASDEESMALGAVVEVVRTCTGDSTTGRIRYGGTTWMAQTLDGEIPAGSTARLLYRENLAWIVEPADGSEFAMAELEKELAADAARTLEDKSMVGERPATAAAREAETVARRR
jgi:membrane protein implicated in regulation of membrane protease activity